MKHSLFQYLIFCNSICGLMFLIKKNKMKLRILFKMALQYEKYSGDMYYFSHYDTDEDGNIIEVIARDTNFCQACNYGNCTQHCSLCCNLTYPHPHGNATCPDACNVVCKYCGVIGHLTRNCPAPKYCTFCKSDDHTIDWCLALQMQRCKICGLFGHITKRCFTHGVMAALEKRRDYWTHLLYEHQSLPNMFVLDIRFNNTTLPPDTTSDQLIQKIIPHVLFGVNGMPAFSNTPSWLYDWICQEFEKTYPHPGAVAIKTFIDSVVDYWVKLSSTNAFMQKYAEYTQDYFDIRREKLIKIGFK